MTHDRSDLLPGTLEPLHGWEISLRLRQMSREVCEVNQDMPSSGCSPRGGSAQ